MMRLLKKIKRVLLPLLVGFLFATSSLFISNPVYADPIPTPTNPTNPTNPDDNTTPSPDNDTAPSSDNDTDTPSTTTINDTTTRSVTDIERGEDSCYKQAGTLGWVICPTTDFFARAIDAIYDLIEELLVVKPITNDEQSPIYLVWEIARNISNICFIIFILLIIYSHLTGLGLSNYHIKKTLPRIVIASILVNLSFIICSISVDVSNIFGASVRDFLNSVAANVTSTSEQASLTISVSDLFVGLTTGGAIAGLAIGLSGGFMSFIWMLIPIVISGLISVVIGLLTISLRQAVVAILIMIAPLAFVTYLLPNTEKWFKKWVQLLQQMLIFYPMFSLLFGASKLVGWVLISGANGNTLWVILGVAVQILPLFLAIPLLKMSNSVLGAVSGFLGGFVGSRINNAAGNFSASHRSQAIARHFNNSNLPSGHLARYLEYRRQLRETDAANNLSTFKNQAAARVQRKISANYDASSYNSILRSNRYTRAAKQAGESSLRAQTAARDASHALNNYGDLFQSRRDQRIAARSTSAFHDFYRAEVTAQSDNEADLKSIMSHYEDIRKLGTDHPLYNRYITSVAGPQGANSVLGQIMAKASTVEERRARDEAKLIGKHPYDKIERSMLVGYYINDQGYATDREGNRLKNPDGTWAENQPGEIIYHDPHHLKVAYDVKDENGDVYYDWKDVDGNFISRVYKKDKSFIKSSLANRDIPIGDAVLGVYSQLSGIKEGDIPGYPDIGLYDYANSIAGNIDKTGFVSKAPWASRMTTQSISKGYIQNYAHLNAEFLDNFVKTVKSSAWNLQDAFWAEQALYVLNPDNWEKAFPEDLIRNRRNVNGELIKGIDANGNTVANEDATYADFMRSIAQKLIFPATQRITRMMSHYTANTIDNQKENTADVYTKLIDMINEKYSVSGEGDDAHVTLRSHDVAGTNIEMNDPYLQNSDFADLSRQVRSRLHTIQSAGQEFTVTQETIDAGTYLSDFENLFNANRNFGTDIFVNEVINYLNQHPELENLANEFTYFHATHQGIDDTSIEDYYAELIQELNSHLSE